MEQRKLDSNKHSVLLSYYHLILVVKYRKKVITAGIGERVREIFDEIWKKYYTEIEKGVFGIKKRALERILLEQKLLSFDIGRSTNRANKTIHTISRERQC